MFDSGQKKIAWILIGFGVVLLIGKFINFDFGDIFWPMVIILIGRDIFIGGIRSVAAANSIIIAAKPFGKWKSLPINE